MEGMYLECSFFYLGSGDMIIKNINIFDDMESPGLPIQICFLFIPLRIEYVHFFF